jgi:hypothetical protein
MQIAPAITPVPAAAYAPLGIAAPPAPVPTPGTPPAPTFDHVFDFPGFATGDQFHLDKGSTVNGISISGNGRLDALTPTSARVWVKGGKFGFKREATLDVKQVSPTAVQLIATQPGENPITVDADIVTVRTGYSEFRPTSVQARNAVLQLIDGKFVVDMQDGINNLSFHLVFAKDTPSLPTL